MADCSAITVDELLAEAVRAYPVLYNKASTDFKDQMKKDLAWQDVVSKTSSPQVQIKHIYICNIGFCSTQFLQCSLVYMTSNAKRKISSSSAILFIIDERRAGIENSVKYVILRVRTSLCLCRWCSHLLMIMLMLMLMS